ncbi:MAG TPA: peptidoglycan DD-metalloendopeptidase family protein [Dermatophilaceae bacterium]|jgi:murein DD-endopeptidase MepM/ murein hydrolase activator NlpD
MVVGVALASTLGLAPVSSADTSGDKKKLDADIVQLRLALEDTSKILANAFVELQRIRAELPGAQQVLTEADAAQVVADRHNADVATALAVARANEAKAADALAQNSRDTQAAQDQLGNMARDAYQQGGVSGLSIALEATSPEDFTNRLVMMDTVMRVRSATLRGLDTMRAEGRAVTAHLVAVRQQVAALKVEAEAALAQANAAREVAAAAKTKLDLMNEAQTAYAATVAARKATEITNIKTMQAQSNALARVLAARARAARAKAARERAAAAAAARAAHRAVPQYAPFGSTNGFLSLPVDAPVSSEFGMRFHPIWQQWILHAGIDFAANCGSPVYAAAGGDVIMATPEYASGGYGNRLVIDHGYQRGAYLTTTYNHLTSFVVTSGHVARGQLVAYSGTTGTSTGCHLHFETREDGTPVNPRLWL